MKYSRFYPPSKTRTWTGSYSRLLPVGYTFVLDTDGVTIITDTDGVTPLICPVE